MWSWGYRMTSSSRSRLAHIIARPMYSFLARIENWQSAPSMIRAYTNSKSVSTSSAMTVPTPHRRMRSPAAKLSTMSWGISSMATIPDTPPARIITTVAAGEVDVAIVWEPLAGYFGRRQSTPLEIIPVSPPSDLPFLPFVYDISMGVRRGDEGLRTELETVLERKRPEIDSILDTFGVPRLRVVRMSSAP